MDTQQDKVNYHDLTNKSYALRLVQSIDSSLSWLEDKFVSELGKPRYYPAFDHPKYKTIPHLPDGYCPGFTLPDGKCFLHSVVITLLLYNFSLDPSASVVNIRIEALRDIIRDLMPNQYLLLGLEDMSFYPENGTVHELLVANSALIHALVYNTMIAIVYSWEHEMFMSHVPVEKRYTMLCDFRNSIEMTRERSGMVPIDSVIMAFDNLARNHVLKLFGVTKLYVIQYAGTIRRKEYGKIVSEDMKRKTNPLYQLESFALPKRAYAGFTIDIPIEQLVFPHPVVMMIHTFDTSHYEFLIAWKEGIPTVPCCCIGEEHKLPDQKAYPGKVRCDAGFYNRMEFIV